MRIPPRSLPMLVPVLALVSALAPGFLFPSAAGMAEAAQEGAAEEAGRQLRDRILAVVDEDPILLTDVEQQVRLGLLERRPGEDERAFHRRVLDQLIEQRLRFHAVDRFGFEDVPVERVEAQMRSIRERFENEAAFRRELDAVGLTEEALRQLVARQLLVLTYVEELLGPRIFVNLEDIRDYYETVFVPRLRAEGAEEIPPIEQVREQIREVLRQQRLNEELDRWTEELRREADIVDYFDERHGELPPVVERLEGAAAGGS